MTTLLIRNAERVATFDDAARELRHASVLVRGNLIDAVGPAAELPQDADTVIDARSIWCCRGWSTRTIICFSR